MSKQDKITKAARGRDCQVLNEWRPIEGFEGRYEVNESGSVRSLERDVDLGHGRKRRTPEIILAQAIKSTYPCVCLCRGSKQYFIHVHRLVAKAFVSGSGPVVRHLDGNPLNPHYSNLAWGTYAENEADKADHGTRMFGEAHHNAVLNDDLVRKIRALKAGGMTQLAIAATLKIGRGVVGCVVRKEHWSHVV